jgi:TolB-like protein
LEKFIKRSGCLEVSLALEIVAQVTAGLVAVHKQKLVHRDIKPSNIMVGFEEGGAVSAKIIDLGLAKSLDEPGSQPAISTPGAFAGTPEYASPEQFAGLPIDIRSDLYSLGATFWEMLTGRAPFRGTPGEVMHQHQHAPLPLEQLRDVPGPLVVLLETLLQKDPATRPQSPAELQTLLRTLRVDLEVKGEAGKQSLSGADAERHRSPGRRRKRWIAIFALLFVVAVAGTLFWFSPKSASPAANSKSVAVLPFENFSDSKENFYFSDGLTSEVIFQLSKVSDLRVISRQSVLRYRDIPAEHQKSLSEIGRELGVAAILESSVERIDDRVRVITGLYDVATNKRLWGASYDREIKDIFAIQSDVAEQIAAALKAGLSADERASISQEPTENVAAYDFYLRGWGLYQLYQKDENEKAIELFKQAIDADPKFALAYTGLADAYIERVQRFHGGQTASRPRNSTELHDTMRCTPT